MNMYESNRIKRKKCIFDDFFFHLFMYAIMYDIEVNAMPIVMNDVEDKSSWEVKIEYACHVIQMHDLKFILQDKKMEKCAPLCPCKVGPSDWVFLRSKP